MRVISVPLEELIWPISTFGAREPGYRLGGRMQHLAVHPRPAYRPDQGLVEELVAECVERAPLKWAASAEVFLLANDFLDGFNGITCEDTVWKRPDGSEWKESFPHRTSGEPILRYGGQAHWIVLAGKSIPHHPAMLRYLVAHEYGHAVFNHAMPRLGYEPNERRQLEAEYMAIRGVVESADSYRAGAWHLSPGEIIANDFRILVMQREVEFWPHHGVPHPRLVAGSIGPWWDRVLGACLLEPRATE